MTTFSWRLHEFKIKAVRADGHFATPSFTMKVSDQADQIQIETARIKERKGYRTLLFCRAESDSGEFSHLHLVRKLDFELFKVSFQLNENDEEWYDSTPGPGEPSQIRRRVRYQSISGRDGVSSMSAKSSVKSSSLSERISLMGRRYKRRKPTSRNKSASSLLSGSSSIMSPIRDDGSTL